MGILIRFAFMSCIAFIPLDENKLLYITFNYLSLSCTLFILCLSTRDT